MKYENHLINESSPYLKSHADNPVEWYPWGEEALKKAEKEDKPLIVSIGYSACHWCHVMAHESFEDREVADFMNSNFVSVKIDREERPDLDKIYMDAAMITSGQGGWPLNALALPDGRPFFGGTYFRKHDWLSLLRQIVRVWNSNREKIYEQAFTVTRGVAKDPVPALDIDNDKLPVSLPHKLADNLLKAIDKKRGGLKGQMKFPFPSVFSFLLEYYSICNITDKKPLTTTLNRMSTGGIYDHIDGGFARYSVDPEWFAPHFEKMLYDNALLTSLYAQTAIETGDRHYKNIAAKTADFMLSQMLSPSGGFYSAYDADSEGVEGLYYTWDYQEIKELLKDSAEPFISFFNIAEDGNWEEGRNILHSTVRVEKYAEEKNIDPVEFRKYLATQLETLGKARAKRVPPALDNKIIASWNGMALKAMTDIYKATGDKRFYEAAIKNGAFIEEKLLKTDGSLVHSAERQDIAGFLDDYAFIINGFLNLYQITFDEKWFNSSVEMINYTCQKFFNSKSGFFYYTEEADTHFARKTEIHDNVIPSSNSLMAENLQIAGTLLGKNSWLDCAEKMVRSVTNEAMQSIPYYSNWCRLLLRYTNPPWEVIITGPDYKESASMILSAAPPDTIIAAAKESELPVFTDRFEKGKTVIYLCRNRNCLLPLRKAEEVIEKIRRNRNEQ